MNAPTPASSAGPHVPSGPGAASATGTDPLLCPLCQAALDLEAGREPPVLATCSAAGHVVVLADAAQAQEYRRNADHARRYAEQMRQRAKQAAQEAHAAAQVSTEWFAAADAAEYRARLSTTTGKPSPPPATTRTVTAPARTGAAGAAPPPAATPHRRGIPTAVLLQGTGALMILGAAVLISAVAWTILPPAGQAALLLFMVAVLGGITIGVRSRIPTTSTILAVLTASVLLVVAAGLPVVLSGLDVETYPAAASCAVVVALLAAGRFGRVVVWRHLGWAGSPLAAALVAFTLASAQAGGASAGSLAAVVMSAAAGGLLWTAAGQRHGDVETAATAWWAAVAAGAVAVFAALGSVLWTAWDLTARTLADRLWAALAVTAVAVMATALVRVTPQVWRPVPQSATALPAALLPLGPVIVAAPAEAATITAALLLPTVLIALLIVGAMTLRLGGPALQPKAMAWSAGTLAWTGAWLLATAPGTRPGGQYFWLNDLAVTLIAGTALVGLGLQRRRIAVVAGGLLLAVTGWTLAWVQGHLDSHAEWVTLPVLAALLITGTAADQRITRMRLPSLWRPLLTLALGAPTFVVTLDDYRRDSLEGWQFGVLVGLLGLVAASGWRSRGGPTLAVGALTSTTAVFALATLGMRDDAVPEAAFAVVALAVAATVGTAHLEGLTSRRHAALAAGITVFTVPTYLIAVADHGFTAEWADVRAVGLVVGLAALTAVLWRNYPRTTVLTGLADLTLLAWWWGWFVLGSPMAGVLEAWTAPWAVLATAAFAVARRTATTTIAPAAYLLPAGLVLVLPSYMAALADPRFELSGAVARGIGLVALGAVLALLLRNRPPAAATSATGALLLTAWWWGFWVAASPYSGVVEVWAAPWAAMATAATAMWLRTGVWRVPRWAYALPALVVLVLPSYLTAAMDPQFDAPFAVLRGIALTVAAAGTVVLQWRRPTVAATAASAELLLLAWWWGWLVAGSQYARVVEVWSLPLAAGATAMIWFWLRLPEMRPRRELLLVPGLLALLASAAAAVAEPWGSGSAVTDVRAAAVVVLLWLLLFEVRRMPHLAAATGVMAIAMTWYQVVSVITGRFPDTAVEVFTWTGAIALAAIAALLVRVAGRPVPTMVSMAPAVAVAFLPTAVLAWSTGTAGWRVWFVLVAASAVLVAGVHFKWAGAVYPSLVSLAVVLIPVLTRLAQDLPTYVPLTIIGTLLLVLGARLEAVRRQGRNFTHWNSLLH